jgi:hypothetical protein
MTFLEQLDADLRTPAWALPIEDVADLWGHDEAVVICRRPAHLEECPDLSVKVRGALGRILFRRACHHESDPGDPFERPCAYAGLWSFTPPSLNEVEISRPYVVHAQIIGDRLEARVRLFGYARWWVHEVLAALVTALDGGIRLKTPLGIYVPMEVLSATVVRVEGVPLPRAGVTSVRVFFLTATAVRQGGDIVLDPASLLMSAVRRVAALAPWMNMTLDADIDALRRMCRGFQFDMGGIRPAEWVRYSKRVGPEPIPVHGLDGEMRVKGPLDRIAPYLALAEITGIGSSTALGLGQVRCILV